MVLMSMPLWWSLSFASGLSAIACLCGRCKAPMKSASCRVFELLVVSALSAPMDYQPAIWLKLSSNNNDPHLIALGSIFSIHLSSSEMKAL